MDAPTFSIRAIVEANIEAFFEYLQAHVGENGRGDTPLFLPMSRATEWVASEKLPSFRTGMHLPIGEKGWRRGWVALGDEQRILGHVDLRAHENPCAAHRALLGMGVERDVRRRGVGRALLEHVEAQALALGLEWIDLEHLGTNLAAGRLYQRAGYLHTGRSEDMFRIDGESVGNVLMSKRLRPAG